MEQTSGGSLQFPHHLLPPTCFYSAPIYCHSSLQFLDQHTSLINPEPGTPLPLFWLYRTVFLDASPLSPPLTSIYFTTPVPLPFLQSSSFPHLNPVKSPWGLNKKMWQRYACHLHKSRRPFVLAEVTVLWSNVHRSKAVLASQKMDQCTWDLRWQQSRNKLASITDN